MVCTDYGGDRKQIKYTACQKEISAMEKNKVGRGDKVCEWRVLKFRILRKCLLEKVISEQRCEGSGGGSHTDDYVR